jgi:WD40 repeat protein
MKSVEDEPPVIYDDYLDRIPSDESSGDNHSDIEDLVEEIKSIDPPPPTRESIQPPKSALDMFPETEFSEETRVPFKDDAIVVRRSVYSRTRPAAVSIFQEWEDEFVFKVSQVESDVIKSLDKDPATCIAVSSKMIAIGRASGILNLLTLKGELLGKSTCHVGRINDVGIFDASSLIATAGADGQVVVFDTAKSSAVTWHKFSGESIEAIALDPDYRQNSTFMISTMKSLSVCRTTSVFGWLKRQPLAPFPCSSIRWSKKGLVAWPTNEGVQVFHFIKKGLLHVIEPPKDIAKSELSKFRCCLSWASPDTLVVGWVDTITVAKFPDDPDAPTMVVLAKFSLPDRHIIGLGGHKHSFLIVLTVTPEVSIGEIPDILLLNPIGEIVKIDKLPASKELSKRWRPHDYFCGDSTHQDYRTMFVVIAPSEMYTVEVRDLDDLVESLLQKMKFDTALQKAFQYREALKEPNHSIDYIGSLFIDLLLGQGHAAKAASIVEKYALEEHQRWQSWIQIFADHHCSGVSLNVSILFNLDKAIIDILPIDSKFTLKKKSYDIVLKDLLDTDMVFLARFLRI